jgi:hypothetical protein
VWLGESCLLEGELQSDKEKEVTKSECRSIPHDGESQGKPCRGGDHAAGSVVLGEIRDIERSRRELQYANAESPDGVIFRAELHWFEAHGIGKKEIKIKRSV